MLVGRDKSWLSAKVVAERALKGDNVAKDIYSEAGRYLGRGISILANSLNPEKIIIGGGVSLAGDLLLDPILSEFNENTMDVVKEKTKVCRSLLGMDAAVNGAVAMALNDIIFDFELVICQLLNTRIAL